MPLAMCPVCKRLALRGDGVCMNPQHPRGDGPAPEVFASTAVAIPAPRADAAAAIAGSRTAATPWEKPAAGLSKSVKRERPAQQEKPLGKQKTEKAGKPARQEKPRAREEFRFAAVDEPIQDGGKSSPLKTIAVVVGILVLAVAVLFGSAKVSAMIGKSPSAPPAAPAAMNPQAVAMPRPKACEGDALWGMRRGGNNESHWSCTTRDGKNVRFYDTTIAGLGKITTLNCTTEGLDGKNKYVDCVRIETKKR